MGRDVTGLRVASVKAKPIQVSQDSAAISEAKPSVKAKPIQVSQNSAAISEAKPSVKEVASVKARPIQVSQNSAAISEAKPSVKEGAVEVMPDENHVAKHDDVEVNTVNLEDAKNDVKPSKIEETKSTASVKEIVVEIKPDENSGAKHNDLRVNAPNLEDAKNDVKSSKIEESKSSSPDKSDDQHVIVSPMPAETPKLCSNTSPKINVLPSPSSSKKAQPNSPFISRKHLDNEDNWSTSSSITPSVRGSARFKTTVPLAPKFCVTDRLEKRKEYYTKLEEKHKALEEEKREYEARNKEEEHAAIKQMRKSMVVKAKPVPSFYYEAPPPKKELKKLPTTRAISPTFSRRKSLGDAKSSSVEERVASSRVVRHSLGVYKQSSIPSTSTPKKKGSVPIGSSLRNERPKQQAKGSSPVAVPQIMTEKANTNISVPSRI